MEEIVNRVASSGLISLDLESLHTQGVRMVYDLKDNLFQGLILKEKDFRLFLKAHDWEQYRDGLVAIQCSADAIIPSWAYMLVSLHLQPVARAVVCGSLENLEQTLFRNAIDALDIEAYRDKKIVVKGCSNITIPIDAYSYLAYRLRPVVASLMFGEPCSTVPLYKAGR